MTMRKDILQRLMEYLRGIPSSGNVAPPSTGRCPECGKTRLTAIEGGKGKKDRDGNEQKKPTAVIGIPYSSDAAEETVEDERGGVRHETDHKIYVRHRIGGCSRIPPQRVRRDGGRKGCCRGAGSEDSAIPG